jgi:hypothetical protein
VKHFQGLGAPLGVVVLLTVLCGLVAGPARGHEEITPATFAVGRPVFLTLTAANDRPVALTKVTLDAPPGTPFGQATRAPAGWVASRTDTAVTWAGGTVEPGRFESFGVETEGAEQPGTLTFTATLGYGDGTSEDVAVEVTATAAGPALPGSRGPAEGRTNLAVGLGASALAVALLGLVLVLRRRGAEDPLAAAEQDW